MTNYAAERLKYEMRVDAARAMLKAITDFLEKPTCDLTTDDWQTLIDARAQAEAAGIKEKTNDRV